MWALIAILFPIHCILLLILNNPIIPYEDTRNFIGTKILQKNFTAFFKWAFLEVKIERMFG